MSFRNAKHTKQRNENVIEPHVPAWDHAPVGRPGRDYRINPLQYAFFSKNVIDIDRKRPPSRNRSGTYVEPAI